MNLKRRSLLIIVTLGIVIIGASVWYKFIFVPGENALPTAAELQSWQYQVDKLTTNLQGASMIQVQFTLQAQSGAVTSELGSRSAQVDDAILSVLHALNASDIAQPGGERMLKDMVLSRINRILTTGKISAVYIDNIIVQ